MKKSDYFKLFFSRPSELVKVIDAPEKAWDFVAAKLYPDGIMNCPHCGSTKSYPYAKKKHHYLCGNRGCKRRYNILYGTIWQSAKLPLHKYLEGLYLFLSRKKGFTSIQMSKDLGICQGTAYLMIAKIQEILDERDDLVLSGIVQIDELMHGPIASYMHKNKKPKGNLTGRSNILKTPVIGLTELGKEGKTAIVVVREASRKYIREVVFKHVALDSLIHTDEFTAYRCLSKYYTHQWCNHKAKKYVVDGVSTNQIESFWAYMRRCSTGTYQKISRKHLQRYCDELAFRRNYRHLNAGELFNWFFGRPQKTLTRRELFKRPTWVGTNKSEERRQKRARGEIKIYRKRKGIKYMVPQPFAGVQPVKPKRVMPRTRFWNADKFSDAKKPFDDNSEEGKNIQNGNNE